MILEDDSTSPSSHHHHHHHDEDDNDSTTTSALATSAITAATYARLDISPIHARRSISGNSMIYSEPKKATPRFNHNRSQRHPYYSSFDDDDCDDDCDDDSNSIIDDDDRNEANDSSFENKRGEDWTRAKHPSLFARPFLRRRPPPFPSLLSTSITDRAASASASAWRIRQQQQRHSTATATKTAAPRNKRTRWLIPARHPLKLCWDVLTVVLSLANAYATHAAIRDREFLANSFLRFCEVWFVIDILLNFCTTRQVQPGVVLHTWQAVWARYLTSWFVIDVLSLFPAEVLYIQPIIEAQKRRGLLRKLQLRSKTVARVTSRLVRYKIWIWARPVLHQTKRVVGMSVVTTIRMLIKYIPKYVLFIRNMKGVIALRALRQVHWIRNVYLTWWTTSRRRRAATRAVAIKKSRSSSSFTLRQRFLLRHFGPNSHYRDDDTEILTEDDGDYGSSSNANNNNNNNPDWEFLRDDDPF